MGMIGVLVALYPKKWRAEFGEEFAALLEDTRLTPRAVANVIAGAGRLHAERHQRLAVVIARTGPTPGRRAARAARAGRTGFRG